MGEVIRKTKGGRFIGWYIRFVDADGKRRAKATKAATAAEAKRILIELEAQAARRQLGVPDRPVPIRGTTLMERWLEESQPRTPDRAAWVLRQRHTLVKVWPYLDSIISAQDAQRIVRTLSSRYTPGTVRNTLVALKSAWRWAASVGLTESSPWMMRPPQAQQRVEYLNREEVTRLLAATDADREVVAVAVRLAVLAGLRVSEVWGLRWRSVDLERGTITVRSGYRDAPTKSRRERVIPLTDQLREALAGWQKRCPSVDLVCPSTRGTAKAKRLDIRRLYRNAKLSVPSAPWHVLRHTFASHFLMSGGSLLVLQRLLGHSSISVTQIYSHLSDDHLVSEVKKLRF